MDVAELMQVPIFRCLKSTIHGTKISACILSTSAAVIEPDSFRSIIQENCFSLLMRRNEPNRKPSLRKLPFNFGNLKTIIDI